MDPTKRAQEQKQLLDYDDQLLKIRSDENGYACTGESLTKQADAFDADINNIIKRFTPEMAHSSLAIRPGEYLDLASAADYHSSLEMVRTAQEDFNGLPAHIRSAFNNDPGQLMDAMYDMNRIEELQKLGILDTPEPAPGPPKETTPTPPTGATKPV